MFCALDGRLEAKSHPVTYVPQTGQPYALFLVFHPIASPRQWAVVIDNFYFLGIYIKYAIVTNFILWSISARIPFILVLLGLYWQLGILNVPHVIFEYESFLPGYYTVGIWWSHSVGITLHFHSFELLCTVNCLQPSSANSYTSTILDAVRVFGSHKSYFLSTFVVALDLRMSSGGLRLS